ncbi:hypothetical protein Tco_1417275 [Tanacetum coccineum]
MDKEVTVKVKDHKRKHDSDDDKDDDDDDEGPSAGSNQVHKETTESDASASNNIHSSYLNWIAESLTQELLLFNSSMHRSDPKSEHCEQSSDDIPMQDEGHVSDLEDTDNAHIPRQTGKKKLCKADLEGPAFNLVKAFHKNNVFLQYQMDECHKLADRKGDKERKITLSISKLKAARYLDFGLEELVPSLWVESECEYDISAMRIPQYDHVKVFKKYGYNYLREIILRRADYQEYKISEKDFKNLHPNDFEDLFLLNIQEKLNHLPKTDKTSLHTAGILGSGQRMTKEEATDFIHCTQEKHRSEDFLQSLENFVGRRIRDIDYS